jgi:hypothetical protein
MQSIPDRFEDAVHGFREFLRENGHEGRVVWIVAGFRPGRLAPQVQPPTLDFEARSAGPRTTVPFRAHRLPSAPGISRSYTTTPLPRGGRVAGPAAARGDCGSPPVVRDRWRRIRQDAVTGD